MFPASVLSRVYGSVTNNNGFWIGWLDFKCKLLKLIHEVVNNTVYTCLLFLICDSKFSAHMYPNTREHTINRIQIPREDNFLYSPVHSLRYRFKQFSLILKQLKSYLDTGTRGFSGLWLKIAVYLDGTQCRQVQMFPRICCFYLAYNSFEMNDIHIKFNKNPLSGSRFETCRRADWYCPPVCITVKHIGQRTHNDK
jgi:hypothetical protein